MLTCKNALNFVSHDSRNSAETNINNSNSQSCKAECVTESMNVSRERLSEEPIIEEIHIEKWNEDTNSTSSRDFDDEDDCQDDCQSEVEQEIVAVDECAGSFGNIVVKNSSDVHFGNSTYYQYRGPVTIKQFVCEDESGDRKLTIKNGVDNFGIQPETVIHKDEECKIRDDNRDDQRIVDNAKDNKIKSVKGPDWLNYVYKKRKLLSICVLIILTILLILLISLLVNKKSKYFLPQWWDEANLSGKLEIISRDDWLAESPNDKIEPLSVPVSNVIIACTSTDSCTNRGKCTELNKYIQRFHMDTLNFADIAYNFMVGGDGYVYEGRGWNGKGAFAYRWNSESIGIGFIGYFEEINAPQQQILAAKMLIEEGVKDGYITQDYKLYAHLQVSNLPESPGTALFTDIKTWPHWTNKSSSVPI